MSGGFFDYNQFKIERMAEEIELLLSENTHEYSEETLAELKTGMELLRKAYIYSNRIDWLLSGDDDQKSFHKRLAEDMGKANERN